MALFMLQGKYSPEAVKAIFDSGTDREAAARKVIEAAGGKLLGFYGMFGQDYNVLVIAEMPGNAEYIATIGTVLRTGTFQDWKTVPLFTSAELMQATEVSARIRSDYSPPGS